MRGRPVPSDDAEILALDEADRPAMEALRAARTEIEDALVRIMTGLVQITGLMRPP